MFDSQHLKMNFIVLTAMVVSFSIFQIDCRSVQLDIHSESEIREEKDLIRDSEMSGIFSWKRLKPILRREIQRIRNVKGTDVNKSNQESTESTISIQLKNESFTDENLNAEKNKGISSKDETKMTNTSFVMSELTNDSQNEKTIDESDIKEKLASNNTHNGIPQIDFPLTTSNFPDSAISDIMNQSEMANISFVMSGSTNNSQIEEIVDESDEEELTSNTTYHEMTDFDPSSTTNNISDSVISDILNQTAESILFQALNDNVSTIDSFDFDETSVLSQGGHIATLQEVSTMGFELLIDSETKQNLLLTKLISSQSNLIDDFTDEDDSDFTTLEFSHINEGEEDETYEEINFPDGISLNKDSGSDLTTFKFNSSYEIENKEITTNEEEIFSDVTDINNHEIQTEDVQFSTHKIESDDEIDLELSDMIQDENGTERSSTEFEHPMCPDPGWCVFWFLALDTCAKDSHCHGSLICCTIGCSKTCIDVDR